MCAAAGPLICCVELARVSNFELFVLLELAGGMVMGMSEGGGSDLVDDPPVVKDTDLKVCDEVEEGVGGAELVGGEANSLLIASFFATCTAFLPF